MAQNNVVKRKIPPQYDAKGNPVWKAQMTSPDSSVAKLDMVPDRVIPVIFVPGVMGSNLIQSNVKPATAVTWRLDSPKTAGMWSLATRDAAFRKRFLQPQIMRVDRDGAIQQGTQQQDEELRRRGWGEVGKLSYGEWLVWLENALNDYDSPGDGARVNLMRDQLNALVGEAVLSKDEVGLSYKYRFPVHACGYNWLASNGDSSLLLGQRIDTIIARYQREKMKCEKVIIVTHSMGGLVARHCSEVRGYRDKIFGIVHGVMPAIGAAAVYRRFKAGTEDPTGWYDVKGALTASALGNDAAEMTAVLSGSPGPLQLLPTPEYGNGWLKIKDDKTEYSLPKNGDPYAEICTVRGKWWSMCEDHLINPLNEEHVPKKRQVLIDADWAIFANIIRKYVKKFHEEIKGLYHPNTHAFIGSHANNRAYGNVVWKGDGGSWLRGDRRADVLEAKWLDPTQKDTDRTVAAQLQGRGWQRAENQTYVISEPDEAGDGTVPHRSGVVVRTACQSFLQVEVGHEPAYKHSIGADNLRACRFTLRAIVKIAQAVQKSSLKYD